MKSRTLRYGALLGLALALPPVAHALAAGFLVPG